MRAEFKEKFSPKQQTGRRLPMQLRDAVGKELDKLIKTGDVEKVSDTKDDVSIQPTVKREKTINIALDARAMTENLKKDKYQMPNLEDLTDSFYVGRPKICMWPSTLERRISETVQFCSNRR